MDCYQIVQLVIAGLVLLATLVLAIAAWKSANSAKVSALAASKTLETNKENIRQQTILQIQNDFGAMQMQECLQTLWKAFTEKEDEIIQIYKDAWENKKFDKVPPEVEKARRYIAWHFTKIYSLHEAGVLSSDDIKNYMLVNEEQINDVLLGMVEKLERSGRPRHVYEFYRNLFK